MCRQAARRTAHAAGIADSHTPTVSASIVRHDSGRSRISSISFASTCRGSFAFRHLTGHVEPVAVRQVVARQQAGRILQYLSFRINTPSRLLWLGGFVLWHKSLRKAENLEESPAERHFLSSSRRLAAAALYSTVGRRQSIARSTEENLIKVPRLTKPMHSPVQRLNQETRQGFLPRLRKKSSSEAGGRTNARRRDTFQTDFAQNTTRQPFRRCFSVSRRNDCFSCSLSAQKSSVRVYRHQDMPGTTRKHADDQTTALQPVRRPLRAAPT